MIAIVNRFASDAVISRHSDKEKAEKAMERLVRKWRTANSKRPKSSFETPIFPYNFKEV